MNEAISVLVVDDDTSIQSIVEETLSDGGYSPTLASTGEEAALLLNVNMYRAIVIDISFGRDRVRGWSIARRARAFDPFLPVIYITGGSADDWAVEGVPNSILLTKPFAPTQLVTAVSQLLNVGPTGGIH
jgi:DNA-binding response OmpR family regulator